ncbi:MAG: MMPL family transporter [Nakamurella sp.]
MIRPGAKRWILPAAIVLIWLAIAGVAGPFAGKLGSVQTNDNAAFLPSSAEATEVSGLQKTFQTQQVNPAVVVIERVGGLSAADRAAVGKAADSLNSIKGLVGKAIGPTPSKDGAAIELIVPLDANLGADLSTAVDRVRSILDSTLPPGLQSYVTGPAGFAADLISSFAGIDGVLLLVAVAVVLLILIVVYRSPILPIIVLLSSLFALSIASGIVYALAKGGAITLNGQSQGILFILVVGAATDYALLLTSRFREELREHRSSWDAMKVALRQSLTPILASGITVIIALLCLIVSKLNSTSSLGPVAAFGILGALLSALTFLPAVLVLLGRKAFWPRRPTFGSEHPEHTGIWGRIAGAVAGRPRLIWVGATAVLLIMAAFLPTLKANGTPQSALFLHSVESVNGQDAAAKHFPAGAGSPAVIIGPAAAANRMVAAATGVAGVANAAPMGATGQPAVGGAPPKVVGGLVEIQATLQADADSEQALKTIVTLRAAEHAVDPQAKVGGPTATQLDTRTTAERDRSVIIPIVLVVIFLLLALLLRALLASLLLLLSVVLSFAASLGVSALVFNHLLNFPGADPSVPLYGFVFLVALGIDYNIFLMTRVREESKELGTKEGVRRGLAVTGGVITSAGIVLAATFSALIAIPLLFLAQIAFIVAFGVLLDTLVVRSLLVPALATDIGRAIWWPSALSRAAPAGRNRRRTGNRPPRSARAAADAPAPSPPHR